jgi:hypothetical protein
MRHLQSTRRMVGGLAIWRPHWNSDCRRVGSRFIVCICLWSLDRQRSVVTAMPLLTPSSSAGLTFRDSPEHVTPAEPVRCDLATVRRFLTIVSEHVTRACVGLEGFLQISRVHPCDDKLAISGRFKPDDVEHMRLLRAQTRPPDLIATSKRALLPARPLASAARPVSPPASGH